MKHSAVRASLHRDLVRPGFLSPEQGKDYDFLLELRETGDYGGLATVSAENARLAVQKAEHVLAAIARLCSEGAGAAPNGT